MWPFNNSSSISTSTSTSTSPSPQVDMNQSTSERTFHTETNSSYPNQSSSSNQTYDSPTSYFSSSNAKFETTPSSSSTSSYTPSVSDLLSNPAFDPSSLHPMAGLGKEDVEYLDIIDGQPSTLEGAKTALPSRGWSDDLCYGTGTTYLSGLLVGASVGTLEGFRRPLGVQSPTFRLRLNMVLNQLTRRGSFFGNSAGVIALIYNIFDASIDAARGKHDIYGAMGAGALSGAIFKCTAGARPMVITSGIMMAAAATWTSAKQALL